MVSIRRDDLEQRAEGEGPSRSEETEESPSQRQAFNRPRLYPFRDYASVRPPVLGHQSDDIHVLRVLYQSKCIELARLQRSYELLEDRLNVVLRENERQREPGGGRSGTSWGARLLASATSFLRR